MRKVLIIGICVCVAACGILVFFAVWWIASNEQLGSPRIDMGIVYKTDGVK